MLQQSIALSDDSLTLTTENQKPVTSSAENSLLLQIQALTEQLLASTAASGNIVQPQCEATPNKPASKVTQPACVFVVMFMITVFLVHSLVVDNFSEVTQ